MKNATHLYITTIRLEIKHKLNLIYLRIEKIHIIYKNFDQQNEHFEIVVTTYINML